MSKYGVISGSYSVQMWENTENTEVSVFGHFSRNLTHSFRANLYINDRTLKLVQNGYENDLLKINGKVFFHA